ncbi:GntR family transcriptional regulator [Pelosinus propionicus]|uniref:DNA-binding transcriptional regulator, GntR family n=1 Tax=Pelosinus propionicus DSM 13327 TaxID=1123291 RepID=A0A1I4H044_9FIRM|nr:GntR family transcriptional regulator [Pelosinus propionicus]SFL35555.1 DNA-binding transcriptional regulator, GntR family [Pelosinus propionicus DSM 13327]
MKNNNYKTNTISHRTIPTAITDTLRERILNGDLQGGMQLKQEELALQFNVSMSALREALKNLEAEDLVKFYPNKGAIVSELSIEEAREIFDIRQFLEIGALELSVPQLTKSDLEEAETVLNQLESENNSSQWGELNKQFHEILYRQARRPRLLKLIQVMHNNVERYMRLYLVSMNYQLISQKQHWDLLNACKNKDAKLAKKILKKHMADASDRLSEFLS